jgi:hypothetical protein
MVLKQLLHQKNQRKLKCQARSKCPMWERKSVVFYLTVRVTKQASPRMMTRRGLVLKVQAVGHGRTLIILIMRKNMAKSHPLLLPAARTLQVSTMSDGVSLIKNKSFMASSLFAPPTPAELALYKVFLFIWLIDLI